MKNKGSQYLIVALLVLMAAGARVINAEMHLYNFAPVAALGLFSGAVLQDKRYAFLFPLLGQFLGDLYFGLFTETPGFYGVSQLFTYGGLIAVTMLGFLMHRIRPVNIVLFSLGGSMLFFILSNFGYFAEGWNGYSWAGLTKTYVQAIPFLRNSVVGDLIGSTLLFGLYSLAQRMFVSRAREVRIS